MRSVYLLLCASVAVISAGHLGNRDHEFIGHQAVQHRIERRTLQRSSLSSSFSFSYLAADASPP